MSMTSLNPGLIFPDDLSDNELVLWRAIKALQSSLAGANGPLAAFFSDGSPNNTSMIGQEANNTGCTGGQVLILGDQFEINLGAQILYVDRLHARVGVNTCTPLYTLDVYSNECGTNVLGLHNGNGDLDIDGFPFMGSNPLTRIRSTAFFVSPPGPTPVTPAGGRLRFFTDDAGTLKERLFIDNKGNIVNGIAALTTTATDGFLHVAASAGAPTGVPTLFTGMVPFTFDSTNNAAYMYTNGAWRNISPLSGSGANNRITIWTGTSTLGANVALNSTSVVWADSNGLLATSSNVGNPSLVWDNVNGRLGVDNFAPTFGDLVIGTGSGNRNIRINVGGSSNSGIRTDNVSSELWWLGTLGSTDYVLRNSGTTIYFTIRNSDGAAILNTLLFGGTASGGNLTVGTTTNATKGALIIGTSRYNEASNYLIINESARINSAARFEVHHATDINASFHAGITDTTAICLDSINDAGNANKPLEFRGSRAIFAAGAVCETDDGSNNRVNRFRHLNNLCKVAITADVTVTDNTVTVINWNTEILDTDTMHDNVTNNTRITVKIAGKYLVGANFRYALDATNSGTYGFGYQVNGAGATNVSHVGGVAGSGAFPEAAGDTIVSLNANDYVEFYAFSKIVGSAASTLKSNDTNAFVYYIGE